MDPFTEQAQSDNYNNNSPAIDMTREVYLKMDKKES
jgi:hypothetical protein